MSKKPTILGAHLSAAGGVHTVFERAEQVAADAVQIFTKSNKSYGAKQLEESIIADFKAAQRASHVSCVVTHAAYLINIASSTEATEQKSCTSLQLELERCEQLEIPYLVLHPGSHTGSGSAVGLAKIAKNLDAVLKKAGGSTKILLETAAGQGTNLGATFEELKYVYDQCSEQKRIGFCLDTCHVHAAGYALNTVEEYHSMIEHFDSVIGLSHLDIIHLNDSKMESGSRRDRHANLGTGTIPLDVITALINDSRLASVPIILETPSVDGITEYRQELALLRELQK